MIKKISFKMKLFTPWKCIMGLVLLAESNNDSACWENDMVPLQDDLVLAAAAQRFVW